MFTRRLLLGAAPLVLAGCASPAQNAQVSVSDDGYAGTYVTAGAPLPDVTLTDQQGQPYNLSTSPKTDIVIVFFGYTNCPDVCSGIVSDLATAKRRMADQGLAEQVTLVLVTTDPARDTPAALAEYLARIDDDFVGLTGDLDAIVAAANSVGVPIEEGKELPSGGYEVDHGTQVLAFGKQRQMQVVWTTGTTIAQYKQDFAKLAQQA